MPVGLNPPPRVGRPGQRQRATAWKVGLLALVVYLISPNVLATDSVRVVPVAHNILAHGTIGLDHDRARMTAPGYAVTTVGSRIYPLFPWTVSLFVLPEVAVFDAVHAVGIGPGAASYGAGTPADWAIELVSMSVVVALAAGVMFLVCDEAASGADDRVRHRAALAGALIFAFGTSAWSTASRAAWQHGPSILLISLALLLAVRSRRQPLNGLWFGAALAAAYTVRPTNAVSLVLLGGWAAVAHRRAIGRAALGGAAVLAPFCLVNLVAYGRLLPPYFLGNSYGGHSHLFEALAGNLVSPSRGLLVFSPVLLLAAAGVALRARHRRFDGLDAVLVAAVAVHWLVISRLPHWWGGWQYGPRLFTDVVPHLVLLSVPALAALAAPRAGALWRTATAGALVLGGFSAFANAEGSFLTATACWNTTPNVDAHPSRLWDWGDPQVLAGVRGLLHTGVRDQIAPGGFSRHGFEVACPPGAD